MPRVASSTVSHSRRPGGSSDGGDGHGFIHGLVHSAPFRLATNLAEDVKDAVVGLPTGIIMLATHPLRTGEAIAENTWHTWSPLFHGDFKQFAEQTFDHPLAPLLDIATIFTGGAGAATKIAGKIAPESALAAAGRASTRTIRAAEVGAPDAFKTYHANPVIRARQVAIEKVADRFAALNPAVTVGGTKITRAVAAERGLTARELGDMKRWVKWDKYDNAARSHAAASARQLQTAAIVHGAKRLQDNVTLASREIHPHIYDNAETHAFGFRPSELKGPEFVQRTPTVISSMTRRYSRKRDKLTAPLKADVAKLDVKIEAAKTLSGDPKVIRDLRRQRTALRAQIRQIDKAHASLVSKLYEPIANKAMTPANGFTYLRKRELFDQAVARRSFGSVEEYAQFLKEDMGKILTTRDPRLAQRAPDGTLKVLRDHTTNRYLDEAARSTGALGKVARGGTTVWKYAILAARPAYFVNNVVGNLLMYGVSAGPHGFRGLVDAYRQVHGPAWTRGSLRKAERELRRHETDWQDKYFLGMHRGFAKDTSEFLNVKVGPIGSRRAKATKILTTGLYDVTHRVSDTFLRRAYINDIMRSNPEVQRLMRKGMHFNDAASAVAENRAVREMVQDKVNDALGQYHYLNPTERFIRGIVPFYTWDRAIVRHGGKLFLERPGTVAAMQQVGMAGTDYTEQVLGEIPDWLKGAIPLSLFGFPDVEGRTPIVTTTGLNPYSTLEGLLGLSQAVVTGDTNIGSALASQLHPAIAGTIETTTGQSLLTGAKLPVNEGGILPRVLANIGVQLPETNLIKSFVSGPQGSYKTMFAKDSQQYGGAFVGVPIKYLNKQAAAAVAERENGKPASRRKKKSRRREG